MLYLKGEIRLYVQLGEFWNFEIWLYLRLNIKFLLFVGFVFGINGYGFLYVRVLWEMFIVCKIWRFFEKVFGLIKEMLLNWSLIIFMLFRYLKVLFLICLS